MPFGHFQVKDGPNNKMFKRRPDMSEDLREDSIREKPWESNQAMNTNINLQSN